jgi:hypothetical protein
MTRRELAAWIRTPPTTLAQWAWRGYGPPHVIVGRKALYRRQDVESWIKQREAEQRANRVETDA